MPCPVLYFYYSRRIWSPLVQLLSATSTITDEALSFILFLLLSNMYCNPTQPTPQYHEKYLKLSVNKYIIK